MSGEPRQRAETLLASVEKQSPGLVQLAEVLSLAVRVEPALLRKARLTLTPKLGVGTEADLWFGPLVESSGAGGFVFRREVAELLRERLASNPARLEAAWKLTRSFHPFIPPAAALEEEVTWAALSGHSQDEVDRKLGTALKAMLSNPKRGVGIARWALRALPRLPKRARRSDSAALLAMGTVARVDGTWLQLNGVLPEQFPPQVGRVLGELPRVARKLVRGPEGITFLGPEAAEGQRIELPGTQPPLLELAWETDGEEHRKLVVAEPGTHEALPRHVGRLQLRTVDGYRWVLTSVLAQEQQRATAPSEKPAQVFLSRAWPTSLQLRTVLAQRLPEIKFTTPTLGEAFSYAIGEALLEAKLVLVVAEAGYWRNEACRRELQVALLPYTRLPTGAPPEARRAALEHIVIIRPEHGFERAFEELPKELLETQWPKVGDVSEIASFLRRRLSSARLPRLRERLVSLGLSDIAIRDLLWNASRLPPPSDLTSVRHHPGSLPQSLEDGFIGRANDLWKLDALLSARTPSTVVLVEGLAGVGKTRFALEYLHRFGPRSFPGGIFWVNAETTDNRIEEQLHGILRTLQPKTPELPSFQKQGRSVTHELARALEEERNRAPILYVVDGLPEPLPGRRTETLSTYCPGIDFVSVLVTTRETLVQHSIPTLALTRLRLGLLDSNPAVELLTQGIQKDLLPAQEWQAIAQRVGNLPLALETLNRFMWLGQLPPQSLFARLNQDPLRFLDELLSASGSMIPMDARSISGILEDTYAGLPEQEKRLMQRIAWCLPAPIPIPLLEAMGSEALAATASIEELDFLAKETIEDVPAIRMHHRLLGDYIRSISTAPAAELMRVCRGLLTLMEPDALRNPPRWPLLRACLPHAEDVFEKLSEFPLDTEKAEFVELGIRVSQFLLAEGHPARARPFASKTYEHAAEVLGLTNRKTIDALASFAAVERSEGHYPEALRLYAQRRDSLGDALRTTEHPDFFVALMDFGETLLAQGDPTSARKELQSALYMASRFLGTTHPQTALVKLHLGQTLQQQREFEEARKLQQEALETLRQTLGRDHLDTLTLEVDLAATLAATGDRSAAQQLEEEVLDRSRTLLGEEHPLTLKVMANLAEALETQGQWDRAGELRARAAELLLRPKGQTSEESDVEEAPEEEATSFPPPPSDIELQDLMNDRFFSDETPDELSEMGAVRVDTVDVTWFEHEAVIEGRRVIHGEGTVGVDLLADDDELSASFPFEFTVEQHADGSLHINDLIVDTSSFYEEQADMEGDETAPEEPTGEAEGTDESEAEGTDESDEEEF